MHKQTTNHLLMVRPEDFAIGSPTHLDNHFQSIAPPEKQRDIAAAAIKEFDAYVETLRSAGLKITVMEDQKGISTPDSVFPNNWFSTHEDGLYVTYPMYWPQRRVERRDDVLEILDKDHLINRTLALEHWESEGRFLEGTGSLVLDRQNRIAYACFSERATKEAIGDWCDAMDYKPLTFNAFDQRGGVIYHTNVMLAIGNEVALVCLDAVTDPGEKTKLTESLFLTGKRIIGLSQDQVDNFGGNALEVQTPDGPAWVMSSTAYNALDPAQREALGAPIIHAPLPVIEKYGGGSARCMISEIFLPKK
ncbi:citrulline utilization hydrolase CtlX [Neolewinella persica]|uniref:citrulline utilization hydrolase CtlX n=1 Tax=Neolewinella persica TaxID=70998 RepID=UPI00037285A2|nr:arginine deiminase-related protein [Neolewinella persica]